MTGGENPLRPVVYIFDVDGTLTPARQPIRPQYGEAFKGWMAGRLVYLITGSDVDKLREQLDEETLAGAAGYYTCAGSELWVGQRVMRRKTHDFPADMYALLNRLLATSTYRYRAGNHIEERTGMINFSVVGRNASAAERQAYQAWDNDVGERLAIVAKLRETFPTYDVSAGGQISIDIVPAGNDKSQIVPELLTAHPGARFSFFGDRMGPTGNDRSLGKALVGLADGHRVVEVADDADTFAKLKIG